MKFDSPLERDYYSYLEMLKKAKQIKGFEYHPSPIIYNKVRITRCNKKRGEYVNEEERFYTPDFLVTLLNGENICVEVKGYWQHDGGAKVRFEMATAARPDIRFHVVKFSKERGFYVDKEYNRGDK
jgi:hypothetical protein